MTEQLTTKPVIAGFTSGLVNPYVPPLQDESKARFGLMLLFPKNDAGRVAKSEVTNLLVATLKEKFGLNKKQFEELLKSENAWPIVDGADGDYGLDNFHCVRASSKFKPTIVGVQRDPVNDKLMKIDDNDVQPGNVVRVRVSAFAWEYMKRKGVSLNLHTVQKLSEGIELDLGNNNDPDSVLDGNTDPSEKELLDGIDVDLRISRVDGSSQPMPAPASAGDDDPIPF